MNRIIFDPIFLEKIQSGEKITTIRRLPFPPTDYRFVFSNRLNILGKITGYRRKLFKNLTEENAKSDGFNTLDELKTALKRYYPKMKDSDIVYIHYLEV